MKHKKSIILIIISFLIILTGCWNRHELNEIAIVTGGGIDKSAKKDKINFVYQVVNPSSINGKGINSTKTPILTMEYTGKTLFQASRIGTKELSRKLFFGHMQIFIINEEVARKKGIEHLLDFLYRNYQIREDILLFIAKGSNVVDILSIQSILETNSAIALKKHLENVYENEGFIRPVELRNVINNISSDEPNFVIPTVELTTPFKKGDSEVKMTQNGRQEPVISIGGYAVFKKDKLIGYLTNQESRSLNFITNHFKKTIITVSYKGVQNSIEIVNSNTKIKTDFKHGKPIVEVSIKAETNIAEMNSDIDLTKMSSTKKFESLTNKQINKEIKDLIDRVKKKYKIDIFEFHEAFYRQHPQEWKKYKKNWDEYFKDLDVKIIVNTTIREIGMKNRTYLEKKGKD